ncbi:HNH endonuclease [Actinophytocola glycyrrhizae]|uniref:HNH endonuclease n=1 Tax=Actinophytocola glycyrrhizae TaxID=2044873 RepID=A0ABV9S843_9PSEU
MALRICLDPVDRRFRAPDPPRSPSVDHIKSVSTGGTHTKNNVRLTHLFCNMGRGYVDKPTLSSVRVIQSPARRVARFEASQ